MTQEKVIATLYASVAASLEYEYYENKENAEHMCEALNFARLLTTGTRGQWYVRPHSEQPNAWWITLGDKNDLG